MAVWNSCPACASAGERDGTRPLGEGYPPSVNPRHLYLHVPFCVRRCGYCDFAVTALRDPPVDAWLDAVVAELGLHAAARRWPRLELDTLYVGGGTPSLLGPGAMAALRRRLEPHAVLRPGGEWTAEANPESFTPALAEDWAAAGIGRLSLGVQTFHEPSLRWMGRMHGAEGPGRAMAAARAAGFVDVSVDLIFGLPARLGRDWGDDLDRALALEPDHVSLYGLTAEPATPLGRRVHEGREQLADEDRYEVEYLLAAERLGTAGFEHYEVSNFARPGRASRHNRAYWRAAPYLGLGPGAHSFLPPRRFWNIRDWAAYRQRLMDGRLAVEDTEEVNGGAARLEAAWLGLRSSDGIAVAALGPAQRALAERWCARGVATTGDDGTLRLNRHGWLLLDALAVELAEAGEPGGTGAAIADAATPRAARP
jgi:oxygen-independent coproporphyrinogen III oxidase